MAAPSTTHLHFLADAAHLLRLSAPETSAHLMRQRSDVLMLQPNSPLALATSTDGQRQHTCTGCGHILIPGCNGTRLTIQSGRPAKSKQQQQPQLQIKQQKQLQLQVKQQKQPQLQVKQQQQQRPGKDHPRPRPLPHSGIRKVISCGLCGRDTRISLPPPPPLPKHRKKRPATAMNTVAANTASTTAAATATTSTAAAASAAAATASATTAALAARKPAAASANANSKKRAKTRKAGLMALLDKNRAGSSSSTGLGGLSGLNLSLADFRKK